MTEMQSKAIDVAEDREVKEGQDLAHVDFGRVGKMIALLGLAGGAVTTMTGCGPAMVEKWEDVGPNQTAFRIEMEGDKQTQFESEKFLQDRKVPAKRIPIEQRTAKTGRMPWNYRWIPTTIVVKVDRGLETREWTSKNDTGSAEKNQALLVTTKDGTGIYFGINLTARIDEPMAARYLYYHGGRPLSEVVDTNIRSDIQGILSEIVGNMNRTDVQNNLPKIFGQLEPAVRKLAMERGISIETIGPAEGLKYANADIQKSIDAQIIAENMKKTAVAKQEAARIENATAIEKAKADAAVAQQVAANVQAWKAKAEVDAVKLRAEAALKMAESWDGKLPQNVMPANSPFLQQLGVTPGGK